MVAVFFFAATPHDFIHDELASHKDTVDGIHKHTGVSVIHIHCEFLQVSLSPTLPGQPHLLSAGVCLKRLWFGEKALPAPETTLLHYRLRGPPESC